jgi:hypothetical protein
LFTKNCAEEPFAGADELVIAGADDVRDACPAARGRRTHRCVPVP